MEIEDDETYRDVSVKERKVMKLGEFKSLNFNSLAKEQKLFFSLSKNTK